MGSPITKARSGGDDILVMMISQLDGSSINLQWGVHLPISASCVHSLICQINDVPGAGFYHVGLNELHEYKTSDNYRWDIYFTSNFMTMAPSLDLETYQQL